MYLRPLLVIFITLFIVVNSRRLGHRLQDTQCDYVFDNPKLGTPEWRFKWCMINDASPFKSCGLTRVQECEKHTQEITAKTNWKAPLECEKFYPCPELLPNANSNPQPQPASICSPCQEFVEVAILIAAHDDKKAMDSKLTRHRYEQDIDGMTPKPHDATEEVFGSNIHRIEKAFNIRDAIIRVANSKTADGKCRRIALLVLSAHGALGYLAFRADNLNVLNVEAVFNQLACAFTTKTKIVMHGCNTGRGCRGEDMLQLMAKTIFTTVGGTIKAYTSYTLTDRFALTPYFSLNLDAQYITADPGPSNVKWDNTPSTPTECADRLNKLISDCEVIQRNSYNCEKSQDATIGPRHSDTPDHNGLTPNEVQLKYLDFVRNPKFVQLLQTIHKEQVDLGSTRIGFTEKHYVAARHFAEPVQNAINLINIFSELREKPCVNAE